MPKLAKMMAQYIEERYGRAWFSKDSYHSGNYALNLFLRLIGNIEIGEIDEDVINEFIATLNDRGYSRSTIWSVMNYLKPFFTWLELEIDWKLIRVPKPVTGFVVHWIPEKIIYDFWKWVKDKNFYHYVMFRTGYEAALRASELVDLRTIDFLPESKTLVVTPKKRRSLIRVQIPISDALVKGISEILEGRNNNRKLKNKPWLFITPRGSKWIRWRFSSLFRSYMSQFGHPEVRYHDYARHSRATNLLSKGVDIMVVKALLRHARLRTTQWYAHVTALDKREIIEVKIDI